MRLPELTFPFDALAATAVHRPVAVAHLKDMLTGEADRPGLTVDDTHVLEYAPAVTLAVGGQTDPLDGCPHGSLHCPDCEGATDD